MYATLLTMRAFGRGLSRWWLLVLVPVALLASPLPIILLFAGSHVAGAILGPLAIWSRTRHAPPRQDLVGTYRESKRSWARAGDGSHATLELRSDGTMRVDDLPNDNVTSVCKLSGAGAWSGPYTDRTIVLHVVSARVPGACQSGADYGVQLIHQPQPYGLYWVLGDPDSGTGIWLTRK